MERTEDKKEQQATATQQPEHHFAAPEVEERHPHEYAGEGLHRRESLSGKLPEEQDEMGGTANK